ncbi:MAG: Flagellar hook protein FlgE [Phycisphaerae bacterium]|nr:Flagellar hook protein FlgE [Phycisphaerae bacterium]
MGLTSALYTGLTGLNANQFRIDTIGNNVANVNTTAFKSSRALFQTQFSQTYSFGNGPSANSGGVNPTQIGLGTALGSVQRNFNPGSIETTGIASDLAIEGNGFFMIRKPDGQQVYTRDGAFTVSTDNRLVTADGNFVQGFGVDGAFNVVPGVLTDLTVPLGTLTLARATQVAAIDGDLAANGTVATQGSLHSSQALVNGAGAAVDGSTALTDVRSASGAAVALFNDGSVITVSRVAKGGRELPDATFTVGTDGATLDDFANWLERTMGIDATAGLTGNPGVSIENGSIVIRGNAGEQNDIEITGNDFRSDNTAAPQPFTFTKSQSADGSGVYTGLTVYDSLGNPVIVNLTMVLEATPNTGPVWRFFAETPDGVGGNRLLGTGTITFDTDGNFVAADGNRINIDRSGTGAETPLTFDLDFSAVKGLSTVESGLILADQDGFPPGTLTSFGVGSDGMITGVFTNGLSRTLGQVALSVFDNPAGLIADSDNNYLLGPNVDQPVITPPGGGGAGTLLGGALELSNVDLAREFIGLITSSTGFQAASRVITVSSDLLNQLLLIAR